MFAQESRIKPRKSDGTKRKRHLAMKRTLRIGTWNIQGIANKYVEIEEEISKQNIDIIALSETKKKGQGNEKLKKYIHLWSGVEKHERAKAGVSLLVKADLEKFIKEYSFISERIVTITLNLFGTETIVIGIYAPNDDATQQIKDQFYWCLSQELNRIKGHQDIIIAGDFNARVGSREQDEVVGKYGENTINGSGEHLIEFCNQFNLKILNSHFPHKHIHRYTWERPTLQQKSIIDYIITRQKSKAMPQDCRVKRGANCGSDHYLVVSRLVYPFRNTAEKIEDHNNTTEDTGRSVRYNLFLLQQGSIKDLFKRRLEQKLKNTPVNNIIEEEYESLKQVISKTAAEVLGTEARRKKSEAPWMSEEIKEQVKEKNDSYKRWLTTKLPQHREEYQTKNRELRRSIKTEKNSFWEQKCIRIENLMGGAQSTEAWKTVANLKKKTTHVKGSTH